MAIDREMFGEGLSAAQRLEKVEDLKAAFAKSEAKAHSRNPGRYVMKSRTIGSDAPVAVDTKRLEAAREALSKSEMTPDVQAALAELAELQKEITAGTFTDAPGGGTGGVPGSLRPYDLEAPAKILVPRFTPLRNELPRVKGVGGAHEYRRILGYSNAGIGGVPEQNIFFNSETTSSTWGNLSLLRPPQISYAMDDHNVAYVEAGVSDSVSYKAQFSSLGFENVRSLSQMALLWAHMLGEERGILYGRGASAQGYAGSFGNAPSAPTATASTTGGSLATGSYTVAVAYEAGVGTTSATQAASSTSVTGPNGSITVTTSVAAGAYGTDVYVELSSQWYYVGTLRSGTTFTITTLGQPVTLPTTDTTASNGYDGLLTELTGPNSGYVGVGSNYVISGSSGTGDKFIQDATQSLYNSVYADPDEVWLNVNQSRALGDYFRSEVGGAQAFRINFNQTGNGQVGTIVDGVYNQSSPTRKMMDLRVHPYMPYGCAIIRSRTLDIPDSGIGDTSEVVSVQEYMAIEWPEIQFTYDSSTYWLGTLCHYAPAWSGAYTGLST